MVLATAKNRFVAPSAHAILKLALRWRSAAWYGRHLYCLAGQALRNRTGGFEAMLCPLASGCSGMQLRGSHSLVLKLVFVRFCSPSRLLAGEGLTQLVSQSCARAKSLRLRPWETRNICRLAHVSGGLTPLHSPQVWMSLLMIPGSLVSNAQKKLMYLVLSVSAYGFMGWRCMVMTKGGVAYLSLAETSDRPLTFEMVHDPATWKSIELGVTVPGENGDGGQLAAPGIRVTLRQSHGERLLAFSMKRGLPNMTVYFMKKLCSALGVASSSGRKPSSEGELMQALGRHILGDGYGDTTAKSAIAARIEFQGLGEDDMCKSPLFSGDLWSVLEEGIGNQELADEILKCEARVRHQMAKGALKKQAMESAMPMTIAAEQNLDEGRRQAVQFPPTGLTQVQAKRYLPPHSTISKERTWHHRWKVSAEYLGSRSKSFEGGNNDSDNEALRFVLFVVWRAWHAGSGQECPWDFGGEGIAPQREF